jgi:hypothetical protein
MLQMLKPWTNEPVFPRGKRKSYSPGVGHQAEHWVAVASDFWSIAAKVGVLGRGATPVGATGGVRCRPPPRSNEAGAAASAFYAEAELDRRGS